MDILSPQARSEQMARIRSRDTKPELRVRKLVRSLGLRYLLHDRRLPGRPDLVFPSHRSAIFVNGCFWHQHQGCALARLPKSRVTYWHAKLDGNRRRDNRVRRSLRKLGWRTLIVWECQIARTDRLVIRLSRFLRTDFPT
jgi:DNA mismatch endonuclease (patch repair protein)